MLASPLRSVLLLVLPFMIGLAAVQPEAPAAPEPPPPEVATEPAAVGEPVPARIELLPDVGGISLDLVLLGLLGLGYGAYHLRGETEPSASPAASSLSDAPSPPAQPGTRSSRGVRLPAPERDATSRAAHGT